MNRQRESERRRRSGELDSIFKILLVNVLLAALMGLCVGGIMVTLIEWLTKSKERGLYEMPPHRLDLPEWDRTGSERIRQRLNQKKEIRARWSQ